MKISTTWFGTVDLADTAILTFPEGILGFEAEQEYCLTEHAPNSPFLWMQAVHTPSLAFVVINPFEHFLDYDIVITDADVVHLRIASPEDVKVITLVTIGEQEITTNLVGPIVVNQTKRLARQIVLSDSRYGTRHLLPTRTAQPTR